MKGNADFINLEN